MYQIYGISNCNTVKKALSWLDGHHVAYTFHNYKKEGASEGLLMSWCKQVGWEALVNKKGTTWRTLPEDVKIQVTDEKSAVALMREKTSVIKRPLIEKEGKVVMLGFDDAAYEQLFK